MLQVVVISGAIILAVVVAMMLSVINTATQDSITATEHRRDIESLMIESKEFVKVVQELILEPSSDNIRVAHRSVDRWFMKLVALQNEPNFIGRHVLEQSLGPLARIMKMTRSVKGMGGSDNIDRYKFVELGNDAVAFSSGVAQLNRIVRHMDQEKAEVLFQRRRLAMSVIGVLFVLYLAAVEYTRHWTTRRLVKPVERLADAAIKAMAGQDPFLRPDHCSADELNALSPMLSSFIKTVKAMVDHRTAELQRQKDNLEHEVTVRRQSEEQLRHGILHDRLTGLCNRELLVDRLDRCLVHTRRHDDYKFGVLFLDIDRFKEINDSLGHAIGDKLLIAVADRLETCVRKSDTVARAASNTVARIGGDEFVILLDGLKQWSDAAIVAQRIQEEISQPFKFPGHEVFTTASIGISTSELAYELPDDLLRDADAAMYHAKASGKARHEVFNHRMHAEAMARIELGNDLRRAVENDEFLTYYQPIVALDTGRISGFEVLVRWEHPTRGLVSPLEFISRAEETGLIVTLGHRVLNRACRQLRQWRDDLDIDPLLSVSVNVSKRQAADPSLVQEVEKVLDSTGIPGSCLKLEITESVIMSNPDSIAKLLGQIKKLGVQIHMDDFGTGYSSLSCLHRFPIDLLKIDREFMGLMDGNREYTGVVHTLVVLAHNLNMEVTVEGVENQEQLSQLLALDSDYAQGFYFSKPVSAEQAQQLLLDPPIWHHSSAA